MIINILLTALTPVVSLLALNYVFQGTVRLDIVSYVCLLWLHKAFGTISFFGEKSKKDILNEE